MTATRNLHIKTKIEVAKADLARSNQYQTGLFFLGPAAIAVMISVLVAQRNGTIDKKMAVFLLFVDLIIVIAIYLLGKHVRKHAILTLDDLHHDESKLAGNNLPDGSNVSEFP